MILLSLLRGIQAFAATDSTPSPPAPFRRLRAVPAARWLAPLGRLIRPLSQRRRGRRAPMRVVAVVGFAAIGLGGAPFAVSARPAAEGWQEATKAFEARDYDRAAELFAAGAEAAPEEGRWHQMLGFSRLQGGHPAEAVAALERAVGLSGDTIYDSMVGALAEAQIRSGDPAAAFATLDRYRPDGPSFLASWQALLAAASRRMDEPQATVATLSEAIEQAPDSPDLRIALGRALAADDRLDAAFEHYAAVAAEDPFALRKALETAFDAAGALPGEDRSGRDEWYQRAADLAIATPAQALPVPTLLAAGEALFLSDRVAAAEERFRAALQAEPTLSLAIYQLARSRLAQGDPKETLRLLEDLLTAGDGGLDRRVALLRAQALAELERWAEAAAAYRKAGDEVRAGEMEEVAAAIAHNRGVEAAAEKCRQRWAEIARLRDENRDVEGTSAWAEIDRRAQRLETECGPEPVRSAAG